MNTTITHTNSSDLPQNFTTGGYAAEIFTAYQSADGVVNSKKTEDIAFLATIEDARAWTTTMTEKHFGNPIPMPEDAVSLTIRRPTTNEETLTLNIWPLDAEEVAYMRQH